MPALADPILDLDEALDAAVTLRQELGVRTDAALPCVMRVAEERLGLDVIVAKLPQKCSGLYLPRRRRGLIFVNGTHAVVRQRFTVAHEAGHHVLRHGAAPRILTAPAAEIAAGGTTLLTSPVPALPEPAVDDPKQRTATPPAEAAANPISTPTRSTDPRERVANAFAAELLAPTDAVRTFVAQHAPSDTEGQPTVDFDLVVRLSAAFGISALSTLTRLETASVLQDPALRAALQARVDAGEHIPRYEALGLRALSDELQEIFDIGTLPRLPEGTPGAILEALLDPSGSPAAVAAAPNLRKLRVFLGLEPATG